MCSRTNKLGVSITRTSFRLGPSSTTPTHRYFHDPPLVPGSLLRDTGWPNTRMVVSSKKTSSCFAFFRCRRASNSIFKGPHSTALMKCVNWQRSVSLDRPRFRTIFRTTHRVRRNTPSDARPVAAGRRVEDCRPIIALPPTPRRLDLGCCETSRRGQICGHFLENEGWMFVVVSETTTTQMRCPAARAVWELGKVGTCWSS